MKENSELIQENWTEEIWKSIEENEGNNKKKLALKYIIKFFLKITLCLSWLVILTYNFLSRINQISSYKGFLLMKESFKLFYSFDKGVTLFSICIASFIIYTILSFIEKYKDIRSINDESNNSKKNILITFLSFILNVSFVIILPFLIIGITSLCFSFSPILYSILFLMPIIYFSISYLFNIESLKEICESMQSEDSNAINLSMIFNCFFHFFDILIVNFSKSNNIESNSIDMLYIELNKIDFIENISDSIAKKFYPVENDLF